MQPWKQAEEIKLNIQILIVYTLYIPDTLSVSQDKPSEKASILIAGFKIQIKFFNIVQILLLLYSIGL
jgi:hypothetical protein